MSTWKYSTRNNNKTAAYLLPKKQYTNIFYGNAPPAPRYPAINPYAMDTSTPLHPVVYEAATSLQPETAALANAAVFTSFGSAGASAASKSVRAASNGRNTAPSSATSVASTPSGFGTAATGPAAVVQNAIIPAAVSSISASPQNSLQNSKTSLSALAASSKVTNTSTEFSFCLPTSLAFFRNLTWEQTPWIPHLIDGKPISPLNREDAKAIKNHLPGHLGQHVSISAIQNGLLLGSAYPTSGVCGPLGTYPHVFVIFPHAKTHAARNHHLLRTWHDEVVKPAFDRAWKDSSKATTYGAEKSSKSRLLQPNGVHTANDAADSEELLVLLHNHVQESVRVHWPTWSAGESDRRAAIMDKAWDAMKGIVEDHPNLADFQDPILLAVGRGEYSFSAQVSSKEMYKDVALEWDKYVDARFVVPKSFDVLMQSVIGFVDETVEQEESEEYEDCMVDWMHGGAQDEGGLVNPEVLAPKRPAKKEAGENRDGEGDGHRHKRRRA
jgi:hypothetical protein